jgi:hypothetical protein
LYGIDRVLDPSRQVDSRGTGAFTLLIPLHGISARKFGVLVMIWFRREQVPLLAFVAMLNCSECQLSNDVAHF